MKFYAKVTMSDTKTAQEIVRVWGEHFNPESSIFIKGNEAKVCFFFDDSPKEMTDILSKCRVDKFSYESFKVLEGNFAPATTKQEESKTAFFLFFHFFNLEHFVLTKSNGNGKTGYRQGKKNSQGAVDVLIRVPNLAGEGQRSVDFEIKQPHWRHNLVLN